MHQEEATRSSVTTGTDPGVARGTEGTRPARRPLQALLLVGPLVLVTLLQLLSVDFAGAFAVRDWGPVALVALVLVAVGRPARLPRGAAGVAVLAAWAYALWTALSITWSPTPGAALEGTGRAAFYAALFTLPIVMLDGPRSARMLGWLVVGALGIITVVTALRLRLQGDELILAGRLNAPIDYRNGSAALFAAAALALLPFAASRRGHPVVRAAAGGSALLALGLAYATQSRGVVLGFLAGVLVLVLLGPDRLRRLVLVLAAGAAVAVAHSAILAPYDGFVADRVATAAQIRGAADAILALGVAGFAVMLLVAVFDRGLRASDQVRTAGRSFVVVVLILGAIGGAGAFVARYGDPVTFAGDKIDEFRAPPAATVSTGSRLGSTSGPRSDLWRIALRDLRAEPIIGVGQGGYVERYYLERRTDRNLSDPHSLPLQALAELGLVGGLVLLLWIGGAAVVLARRPGPRRRAAGRGRTAVALAAGVSVVLVQAGVDFLWLIPGLMGLTMLVLGTAVALRSVDADLEPRAARVPARLTGLGVRGLAAAGAVVAALLFLSDAAVREARDAQAGPPETQLAAANTAHALDPLALTPRYLQAGAQERAGAVDAARRTLEDAVTAEPTNQATYALLGDLETRAGRTTAARRWYGAASRRNPRDVGLRRLAAG